MGKRSSTGARAGDESVSFAASQKRRKSVRFVPGTTPKPSRQAPAKSPVVTTTPSISKKSPVVPSTLSPVKRKLSEDEALLAEKTPLSHNHHAPPPQTRTQKVTAEAPAAVSKLLEVKDLMNTTLQLFRMSPLYRFDPGSYSTYGKTLTKHINQASTDPGAPELLAKVVDMEVPNEDSGMLVGIVVGTKATEAVPIPVVKCLVFLSAFGRSRTDSGFSSFPVVLARGKSSLCDGVLAWLQLQFDCRVSELSAAPSALAQIVGKWAAAAPKQEVSKTLLWKATVAQLREKLLEHELSPKGLKADLIKRLKDNGIESIPGLEAAKSTSAKVEFEFAFPLTVDGGLKRMSVTLAADEIRALHSSILGQSDEVDPSEDTPVSLLRDAETLWEQLEHGAPREEKLARLRDMMRHLRGHVTALTSGPRRPSREMLHALNQCKKACDSATTVLLLQAIYEHIYALFKIHASSLSLTRVGTGIAMVGSTGRLKIFNSSALPSVLRHSALLAQAR